MDDANNATSSMAPRRSGIFARQSRGERVQDHEQAISEIRRIVTKSTVAVLLLARAGRPTRAAVDPNPGFETAGDFGLAMRLVAWTQCRNRPRAPRVPTYLSHWLTFERALVLPLLDAGMVLGEIVLDGSDLEHDEIELLKVYCNQLAQELTTHALTQSSPCMEPPSVRIRECG